MLDLLVLEQERLADQDHSHLLPALLASTDLSLLEWTDLHYGSLLTSQHFYAASQRWTLYCLETGRHLPLIVHHAWHLLPSLLAQQAWIYFTWLGVVPPSYSQSRRAELLLASYLASRPPPTAVQRALEVVPDSSTAELLLAYCPQAVITPLALTNALAQLDSTTSGPQRSYAQ
jgi:hypothetical protein